MTLFTTFAKRVRSSLLDISSYGNRGETFWKGVRYLYFLCVIVSLLLSIKSALALFRFVPQIDQFIVSGKIALREVYPDELVVTIASGSLSTNVETPYSIDVPPSLHSSLDISPEEAPHLLTIAPDATIDDFHSFASLVLLTEKHAVIAEKDRDSDAVATNFRVFSYGSSEQPFVMNKEKFTVLASMVESYFVFIKPLVIALAILSILLLPFLAGFGLLLGSMIFLLWGVFLLWLFSLFRKKKSGFKLLYTISLYGITASVLYTALEGVFGFHIPFVATLLFFGYMGTFLCQKKRSKKSLSPSSQHAL